MIGMLIAIVVIAALVFWALRRKSKEDVYLRNFMGIPLYTSPLVPPGTMYVFSADLFDFTKDLGPVRLTERLTHDELWYRLSRPPIVNDPKAFTKIVGLDY